MKRKYTREQLEFYFRKLMAELGRVPTMEDIDACSWMPSSHVYIERYGSWHSAREKLGNLSLNKTRCAVCGKDAPFKKKTKRFCSKRCYAVYRHAKALAKIPPKKCAVCRNEFRIKTLKDKKRRICYSEECFDKYSLITSLKKQKPAKLTPNMKRKIEGFLGGKCFACGFSPVLRIYPAKGRESDSTVISRIRRNDFSSMILLCPNHYEMLKKRLAELRFEDGKITYREQQ